MNKKAYIILGGILVLIIIVGGIIFLVMPKVKNPSSSQTATQNTQTSNTTNTSTNSSSNTTSNSSSNNSSGTSLGNTSSQQSKTGLSKIDNEQTIAPILSLAGGEVWYFNQGGSLEELNLSTANLKQFVLPKTLQVNDAIWATQGSDFIIVTNNSDGTKTFNYYSSANQTFTQYPANLKAAEFTPSGNQIVYVWENSNGIYQLEIADPDLSNYKPLISKLPGAMDTIVMNPLGNSTFLYNSATPSNGYLNYVTLADGKLTPIKTNLENAAIWSNDGHHYLYNNYNSSNKLDATLWLGDVNNPGNSVSLGFSTPVSKTAFNLNGSVLYYAVTPVGGGSDSIWSYNISSGVKNQVFDGTSVTSANLTMTHIMISNDGTMLYFVNTNDGYLYSLPTTPAAS